MMERNREPATDLRQASFTPALYMRDGGEAWEHLFSHAAEDARWATYKAAIAFAAREAQLQAVVMPTVVLRGLREAVEDVVGPDRRPPPPVGMVAKAMGDRHPGVRPEAKHRQAWLNYLVASTAAYASRL